MKTIEIPASEFDLAMTLDSGQVFHWESIDRGFIGMIGNQPIFVEQCGPLLKVTVGKLDRLNRSSSSGNYCGDRAIARMVARYFALDHPLAEICNSFPDDPVMNAAQKFCRGLRVIRQPKWECLATFICSSMKQVAHIRQISKKLRERFGVEGKLGSHVIYTFPTAERLAQSSEKQLRECALGYRAINLLKTARLVNGRKADLEAWSSLSDSELRAHLCQLPGVGAKVANCVMLFAYERLGAFPVDVWIERVLREKYLHRARKLNAARLRMFTQEYFGKHGGYAQQYLFHHARKTARRGRTNKPRKAANLSPSRG
jgi:N-glycosylase/DNA lyase